MISRSFYTSFPPKKISEIAQLIECELELNGNQDVLISSIKQLKLAEAGDLSFLANKKYKDDFEKSRASACIVEENFKNDNKNIILLRSKNPYYAYTKIVNLFYKNSKDYSPQIMASAYVAKTAKLGSNCYIGHNVVIEENVEIGDNAIIEAGVIIDQNVKIGNNAFINANASIKYSIIGDNVVILSGARIGEDGFGFSIEKGKYYKIFHSGLVIIGNDVEIGANTTIDRGSLGDTIISDLCRIDNLVQIAHNVVLGKGTILAGQVGIAGSTEIGAYCLVGGQVGFAGHLQIGNQVQIAGGSGVAKDIADKSVVGGSPAVNIREWHRQTIALKKLVKSN